MKRYWIAINGASCACSSMPWVHPLTKPVAQQLLGFRTLQEAREAQRICLQEPHESVERFFRALLMFDIPSGKVAVIKPPSPEPPTRGPTIWIERDPTDVGAPEP